MRRLIYISLFFISSFAFGQQYVFVTSTITGQAGTGDYTATDETTPSVSDYLTSDDNTTTTWEGKFASMTDPQTGVGHIVEWMQAQADGGVAPSSGGSDSSFSAYLYQGGTLIATMASSVISSASSFDLNSYQLTTTEANNITDYTDLRIRMDFVGGGGSPSSRRGVAVAWARIQAPSALPTVVLNTADATAFGTDNTPTLEFTGTDIVAANDLEYNTVILSSFNDITVDSYATSNYNLTSNLDDDSHVLGQTFNGNGDYLQSCQFYIIKVGSATGFARAVLYNITGTYGTDSRPTGNPLAVSERLDVSAFSTSLSLVSFSFLRDVVLTSGTKYAIAFEYWSGTASNYIGIGVDSSPAHTGNAFNFSTSGFVSSASDAIFFINGSSLEIAKNSITDAGFLNTVNGGDTHPFTETEKISFTVQAGDALADGTYYWYSVAKAPSGANVYGYASEIRSFTVNTAAPSKRIFIIN